MYRKASRQSLCASNTKEYAKLFYTYLVKGKKLQGLKLSRDFFLDIAKPLFQEALPDFFAKAAFGLVGEGSECFGFDDEYSQDHDWGAGFCIWMPRETWTLYLSDVETVLAKLPQTFKGHPVRMSPEQRMGRVGPLSIENFYARFIGQSTPPSTWPNASPDTSPNTSPNTSSDTSHGAWQTWRSIPEQYLATSTNGEVFSDGAGEFTAFREALLAFYPEDLRLKKLAARCFTMAQTGQYNLLRCLKRNEYATAMLCNARFCEAAMSATYLLNKRYMPFYKWAHKGLSALPILGEKTQQIINQLSAIAWNTSHTEQAKIEALIEGHCHLVAEELRAKNLSQTHDDWLMEHANQIQSSIQTPELRQMPAMLE